MKNILIIKKWINRFCLISKIILIIFVLQKAILITQNSFNISAYAALKIPDVKTTTKITTEKTTVSADGGDSIIPDYPVGVNFKFKTVGSIVTKLLDYVYVMAGIVLLVMLVTGGLGLMTAAGSPDKMKAGYGKITNALIGFLIIFISYFVVQLVETVLGIKIL